MKPHHLIAPILALAGSAYWLNQQKVTINSLTEKKQVISERLAIVAKAVSDNPVQLASPPSKAQDQFTLPDGSPNWEMIAELMTESQRTGGMPNNIKTMLKLQQKFMGLTEDEIVDGLAKISTLNLKPSALETIKQGLLNQLSEKNPLAALEALGDPTTNRSNSLFWSQMQILSKVAKKDPAAAIAWMDEKIAQGKLESTSLNQNQNPRLVLEGALISQLISSDYDSAKSRLKDFTDDEKIHLLTNNQRGFRGEGALKFLELARETLPPEKASRTISSALGNQYLESLAEIKDTVADLPLSESERNTTIENLVSNYSRNSESEEKFHEIYQWSKTEAPGQEAAIVSNALSNSNNSWQNPQASFEEAVSVSESLGDPEILNSFVSKFSSNGNEATVSRQVKQFKDPAVAEQYRALIEALPKTSTESE